jgi:hypothetical protein
MKKFPLFFFILYFVSVLQAQHSTYTGEEHRAIKSLSEKEIEQYRLGAGMGLAKAAELNHYPGPKHVLEFVDTLDLSEQQTKELKKIIDEMKSAAVHLGNEIVEKEKMLNDAFADGVITISQLERLTKEIGDLQAKLRFVHLRAHITTTKLLTKHQIHTYDILRGYNSDGMNSH